MLKYQAKYIEMRLRVTPEYHDEISRMHDRWAKATQRSYAALSPKQ